MFGPPGAGKGTQARRIQDRLGLPVIASGDLFRAMAREDTDLGREVRGYLDSGLYVPDELTIEVVMQRLRAPDASGGFILDGFPRTEGQARALDEHLARLGQHVDVALRITAPLEVLLDRLDGRLICPVCNTIYNLTSKPPRNDTLCDLDNTPLERRSDQQTETIRTRLMVFQQETNPLIAYYRQRGVLREIDGARAFAEVEAEIDDVLGLSAPR